MTGFDLSILFNERTIIICGILQILGFLLLVIVGCFLRKLIRQYHQLLNGDKEINLEGILFSVSEKTIEIEKRLNRVEASLEKLHKENEQCLRFWSLSRYKAFANTGGDQSFSLVLLDKNADGFIISSIFGRDESRVYAKSIKEGNANYPLSDEEHEALARIIKNIKK